MNTKQLRQKILDLAIRGKLVPQNPADEPASVLLERIRIEKERLIKEGKIRADRKAKTATEPSDKSHYPFDVPESWKIVRLSQVAQIINGDRGKNYPSKEKLSKTGIPFVSASNISNGLVVDDELLCMTQQQYELLGNGKLIYDDIVFCIRGSLGKTGFFRFEKGAIASSLVIVRGILADAVFMRYLFNYLNAPIIGTEIAKYDNGTAQPNLAAKDFENFLFPLPPLAEQHRIVAAIEAAFAVIDEIERNKSDLQSAVTAAKQKILSLAISGKLVPQDPSDEPASVLLDRIKAERAALVKAGKIKPDKRAKSAEITRDNSHYPFAVPKSWSWCALGEFCDYGTCEKEMPKNISDDAWILDLEDIEKDTGKILTIVKKAERVFHSSKNIFLKGQVLYSNLRPYLNKVLVAPENGYCTSEIIPLKLEGGIVGGYIRHLMMSKYFLDYANMFNYGVRMPRLGATNAKNALIPLPPLAEQRRIVVAIEAAFEQLDCISVELQ